MAAAPTVAKIVAEGAANSMKAWVLEEGGDIAKLALKRVEIPTPAAGQLRVKVVTANTNPVDFKHASFGAFGAVFPAVFGCDGAGVVDALVLAATRQVWPKMTSKAAASISRRITLPSSLLSPRGCCA